MYFRDFTPYGYLGTGYGDRRALNIGWLAMGEPFETGYVAPPVLEHLKRLAKTPSNLTRGYHFCEWCVQALHSADGSPVDPRTLAEDLRAIGALGNGEIAVRAPDGGLYVAPVMICHYIEMHGYRPPEEFVGAIAGALDHAVNLLLGPATRGLVEACPPSGPGEWNIDWPAFESRLGTRVPDDYRELVSAYGLTCSGGPARRSRTPGASWSAIRGSPTGSSSTAASPSSCAPS
ncbi:hypothetical protein Val02_09930 [Virgisporangium aliadipatigenens]|uniref:DUF7919 domain-containing protein n=1 Tax=Virgisporangium aliadipatigenens TaxID=741659 RepID=A0A8J3YH27_9ACTN|nr:hypothetical protein [Virgisporangium aliadipatigenens]GIJ44107.1 hypothetical protein Val02_09930 [Virgisporangium aliadipatigenens]